MHPQRAELGGRVELQNIPSQIPARWLEAMEPLPSEVLRPLRDARDNRMKLPRRSAALAEARNQLSIREAHHRQWSASVDERMDRCGMEYVDKLDQLQVAAFLARIDRKALNK